MATVRESRLKHLVVDSGAIIKGIDLRGLAENLWTVSDVIKEIRDKRARHVLRTLPEELKIREPSSKSINEIVHFAQKTGDLRSLSTADLRVLALTHMIETEENGCAHLRKEPMRPGAVVNVTKASKGLLLSASDAMTSTAEGERTGVVTKSTVKGPKKKLELHQGRTLIVRGLAPKVSDDQFRMRFSPYGKVVFSNIMRSKNGRSRCFGFVTFETPESAGRALEVNGEILYKRELKVDIWRPKEEVSTASTSVKTSTTTTDAVDVTKRADVPVVKSMHAVVARTAVRQKKSMITGVPKPKVVIAEKQADTKPGKMNWSSVAARGADSIEKFKPLPKREPKRDIVKISPKKKSVSFNARALVGGDVATKADVHKESSQMRQQKSRIIGNSSSLVRSVVLSQTEDAADASGWIRPDNIRGIDTMNPAARTADKPTTDDSVGCITMDFAMQNVLTQIGLHLVAADGRVIRRVKRFVLKCSACYNIVSNTSKLFCPRCGHNTLRKIGVTLRKDGTPKYHDSNLARPQRGVRYSIPKRRGGRVNNDIMLCEDELMMGKWRLKAGKKSTLGSMFGADVTESLGMRIAAGSEVVVGYGRKNPNAQRGRERRGAKKKGKRGKGGRR